MEHADSPSDIDSTASERIVVESKGLESGALGMFALRIARDPGSPPSTHGRAGPRARLLAQLSGHPTFPP
jgi:hypothetical protein